MGFLVILCIGWLLWLIITSASKKMETSNMYKYTTDISSVDGIIYPVHIKYKMLERNEAYYPNNNAYRYMVENQPIYDCILDNEMVTTISIGQEMDLEVDPGEHFIFFEVNTITRKKFSNKYIKNRCKT